MVPLPPEPIIFGKTAPLEAVWKRLCRVAGTNVPVLVHGDSGTGKEVISRLIHQRSAWAEGPFVKVNCPAIPASLLESELFGYERGAFTGALVRKPGRVEMADRGTLLLDEIGELDPSLQAKFLQLLQDGQFSRIGAQEEQRMDARVICATNHELEKEVTAGSFRRDLFYRISVVTIHLPPLRERSVDVPDLANYFVELYRKEFNCQPGPLSPKVLRLMQEYSWPGNIRELENLIKRYVILDSEEVITAGLLENDGHHLGIELSVNGPTPLKQLTRQVIQGLERKVILQTLQATNWNRRRAAKLLDISYRALLYKIRQAGLPSKRTRRNLKPPAAPLPSPAEGVLPAD